MLVVLSGSILPIGGLGRCVVVSSWHFKGNGVLCLEESLGRKGTGRLEGGIRVGLVIVGRHAWMDILEDRDVGEGLSTLE